MQNPPPTSPRRVRAAHESRSATVRAAAAAPSKRQQSKWRREQDHQRTLFIAIGVLVGLVVVIFVGGFAYDNFIRANEVVAVIGTDNVTASQLVDEMQPQIRSLQGQAKQAGATGSSAQQYLDSAKRDLPDQTLNSMIDKKLMEQEAAKRGISITSADVDDKERQTIADYQNATNPAPTPEVPPTPEGAAAATPQASPTSAPSPVTTPTAVPTLLPDAYSAALQDLITKNSLTEADLRDNLQQSLLQDKLQTAIGDEQVPAVQEQVHARHILVATEDQARDVLTQLQNGADFATLAQQVSTDPGSKDKGGDLGWFGRGVMDKPFEDAAFALQPGQLSDVVQGANGFHVIQVLERDPNRAVPPDQLQTQRAKAYQDWIQARRTGPDVKLQLSDSARNWVLARIGVRP
jgi:parvulin-like peptidyl-prolyl isomerase